MSSHPSGLTSSQRENIEEFLHLFADVEAALKTRLARRANDPTGVRALIDAYAARNPYWTDSANRLRNLADIRNLLTHQRGIAYGYPIALAPSSLHAIREIKEHLMKLEPVSTRYRKSIKCVSPDDSLASVLALAFENGFSQFPVVNNGRFSGLITENEVIRWLGRRTLVHSVEVNLAAVSVRMVLKERDPFLRGIPIFHFEKIDAPVEEVMGRFSAEPALEAILLTSGGGKDTPIEGIVTQWDAARCSKRLFGLPIQQIR
jgi:predicted transcriptional regulator